MKKIDILKIKRFNKFDRFIRFIKLPEIIFCQKNLYNVLIFNKIIMYTQIEL